MKWDMPRFHMVAVQWVDSTLQHDQAAATDIPEISCMTTVGLLLGGLGGDIAIAREAVSKGRDDEHPDVRGMIVIPKSCVQSIQFLLAREEPANGEGEAVSQ